MASKLIDFRLVLKPNAFQYAAMTPAQRAAAVELLFDRIRLPETANHPEQLGEWQGVSVDLLSDGTPDPVHLEQAIDTQIQVYSDHRGELYPNDPGVKVVHNASTSDGYWVHNGIHYCSHDRATRRGSRAWEEQAQSGGLTLSVLVELQVFIPMSFGSAHGARTSEGGSAGSPPPRPSGTPV